MNAFAPGATTAFANSVQENPIPSTADTNSNISLGIKTNTPFEQVPTQPSNTAASSVEKRSSLSKDDRYEATPPMLELSIDPDFLTPGGSFTLSWQIEGVSLEENTLISLQVTLPASFSLEGNFAGSFDAASHILTIPVTVLHGQIHLKADASDEDVVLQGTVFKDTDTLAEASLFLSAHEQYPIDPNGGRIEAEDGQIDLQVPADVFPQQALIDIGRPSGDEVPPYSLSDQTFEIKAHDTQSGDELDQFSEEISISVSYADLEIPEEVEGELHLYWYNPETEDWEALPTLVDTESKTLQAFTDHFTVFDIDVNHWQASHLPTIDSFQVSSFTGAGTYSLPIEVPPGPGGFQPSLALTYNSQVVDQSTTLTQASWVGMGWSLEMGSIEADTHGTDDNQDDTYLLNVAGISTWLIKDDSGAYHARDENFWQISYDGSRNGIWTVRDKRGTVYFFERISFYPDAGDTGECIKKPHLWSLTRVRNVFGQEITYNYEGQGKQVRCGIDEVEDVDSAVYPVSVTYANARYRIRFDRGTSQNRWDYQLSWDTDQVFHTFEKQRLQNIYVEQDSQGGRNLRDRPAALYAPIRS